jgi:putative oxidoreductase
MRAPHPECPAAPHERSPTEHQRLAGADEWSPPAGRAAAAPLRLSRPWNGPPANFSQMWLAGVLETFGGALIVVGPLTRPAAFLLAGEMAVAYFQAHAPRGVWPVRNRGEAVVLFCFVFLHLCAVGAGPFSVDTALRRRGGRGVGARAAHP